MNSLVILSDEDYALCSKIEWRKELEKRVADLRLTYVRVFHYWGFNNYQFFKTIVLRFYPEVDEKHLNEFYAGTVIRQDVLKYVGYTYQILNV